ncbi:MAG: 2-oxoacid:acceptor oxidoreductase family protein [Actinobacteria bacterium]|nr:2-oxoacid:acceptor oxidoreductase family protein [Actinomycetota bacterium]
MHESVIVAGFGGQGILFAGQVLAYAALFDGREVVWMPSYGPEMRGGTANCTVVISSTRVRSPLVANPLGVIAMNRPSFDRFEPAVRPGGVLIVNSSLIDARSSRADIRSYEVPANHIAEELGSAKVANLVVLGSYVAATQAVSVDSILRGIEKVVSGERAALRSLNFEAFRRGVEAVAAVSHRTPNERGATAGPVET